MATGSNYPTSHDTWSDKVTNDLLTVADVNQRTSAIEKIESGPVRPTDGSAGTPAYSFRDDANTGIFRQGNDSIGFSVGGNEVLRLTAAGLVPVGAGAIASSGLWGSIGQTSKNNA